MADDEGQERRSEDLFEDLDKFFAPIQDVDWPEEGEEPTPAPGTPGGGAVPSDEATPAGEEIFGVDLDAPIPWVEPPSAAADEPAYEPAADEPAATEPARDEHAGEPSSAGEDGGFGSTAGSAPADDADTAAAPAPAEPAPGGTGNLAEDMFGPDTAPPSERSAVGESFAPASSTPAGDELLPQGWPSGLDDAVDVDVVVPPASGDDVPAEPGRFLGEPTAEMSGDDWAELQMGPRGDESKEVLPGEQAEPYSYMERFLPDHEDTGVPEFGYGPDPDAGAAPSGGTTGIDWDDPAPAVGGPALEDSGPISIDDLRRAPDAYQDLPGPDDLEPAADTAAPGDAGLAQEPEAGGLEAAAEHFAASIREEEPDLGAPLDPSAPAAGDPSPRVPGDPFSEPGSEGGDIFGTGEHREPYSEHPEPLVFPGESEGDQDDLLSFGEPEGPRTVKVSAAEGTGPSWQEPTSVDVPVEGEHEPPRPSRNLSAAIITGVVLAVVALLALLAGKVLFAFVAGAVVLLAQLELYAAIRKRGYQPAVPLGLAIGALICAGGYLKGEGGILAMAALGVLATPLWYMATPARQRRNVTANMGMTLLGIMAVPFLGGYALAIIHIFSRAFTIAVLGLAFGFDIVAYAIGTLTGNKALAPSISPNKTREGVYGGFLVLAIVGFVVLGNIDPLTSVWQGLYVSIAAAAAAALGDLAESLVKRDLGVKDMGTIFPGHGGALDRIDSILFVAPVVFYLLRILLHVG